MVASRIGNQSRQLEQFQSVLDAKISSGSVPGIGMALDSAVSKKVVALTKRLGSLKVRRQTDAFTCVAGSALR